MSDDPQEEAEDSGHDESGIDLARAIARSLAGRTPRRRPRTQSTSSRVSPQSSGAHPDDRDPQSVDDHLQRLIADRGWSTELRVHSVFVRWEALVGADVAAHAKPESFADGRLVVRTDSTTWATQMRLLAAQLVRRLNEELGDGTVSVIDVVGPSGPTWRKGRYRVKGRGPRDTYG